MITYNRNKNTHSQRNLGMNVHSIVYNNQKGGNNPNVHQLISG